MELKNIFIITSLIFVLILSVSFVSASNADISVSDIDNYDTSDIPIINTDDNYGDSSEPIIINNEDDDLEEYDEDLDYLEEDYEDDESEIDNSNYAEFNVTNINELQNAFKASLNPLTTSKINILNDMDYTTNDVLLNTDKKMSHNH